VELAIHPYNGESVTTQSVGRRLHYGESGSGGDRCINGITTLTQDLHTGFGTQRLRGGNHATTAKGCHTARGAWVITRIELHSGFLACGVGSRALILKIDFGDGVIFSSKKSIIFSRIYVVVESSVNLQ
jgi:hypothetical protein